MKKNYDGGRNHEWMGILRDRTAKDKKDAKRETRLWQTRLIDSQYTEASTHVIKADGESVAIGVEP